MMNTNQILQMLRAVETDTLASSPFPIVAPVRTTHRGQTRIHRIPVSDQTLVLVTWPTNATSEHTGSMVGTAITTGCPRSYTTIWVQEGQEEPTTAPAVAIASIPEATAPEAITTPAQAA